MCAMPLSILLKHYSIPAAIIHMMMKVNKRPTPPMMIPAMPGPLI